MNFVDDWVAQKFVASGHANRKDWNVVRADCEICGSSQNLVLDHCHIHMWVRGWLCNSCNTRIASIESFLSCTICESNSDLWHRCRAYGTQSMIRRVPGIKRHVRNCAECLPAISKLLVRSYEAQYFEGVSLAASVESPFAKVSTEPIELRYPVCYCRSGHGLLVNRRSINVLHISSNYAADEDGDLIYSGGEIYLRTGLTKIMRQTLPKPESYAEVPLTDISQLLSRPLWIQRNVIDEIELGRGPMVSLRRENSGNVMQRVKRIARVAKMAEYRRDYKLFSVID